MQSYRVSKYYILEPNVYNNRKTKQILYSVLPQNMRKRKGKIKNKKRTQWAAMPTFEGDWRLLGNSILDALLRVLPKFVRTVSSWVAFLIAFEASVLHHKPCSFLFGQS
jgi:hypothetical protein